MTFGKAVAMVAEIEYAAKSAKTMYGAKATDANKPIYKVNPVKTAPKQESGETVSGKAASGFKKGTCVLFPYALGQYITLAHVITFAVLVLYML